MSKLGKLAIIFWLILTLLFLGSIRFTHISLETQFIPTIVNGITSSISIIVAFTLTAIAISISKSFKLAQKETHIFTILFTLTIPIATVLLAYLELMQANFYLALRYAMAGLFISVCVLVVILVFMIEAVERDPKLA